MTFLPTVPSQRLAAEYVRAVAAAQKRTRLVLGGHSKGGNIAVYAAFHCAPAVQRRLTAVYSNDGPGVKEPLQRLACYQWMRGKMISIVPESSVVGMLLEHEDNYTVVKSSRQGSGCGAELVKRAAQYARENGIARIALKTRRSAPAYSFYSRTGFTEQEDCVYFTMDTAEK